MLPRPNVIRKDLRSWKRGLSRLQAKPEQKVAASATAEADDASANGVKKVVLPVTCRLKP